MAEHTGWAAMAKEQSWILGTGFWLPSLWQKVEGKVWEPGTLALPVTGCMTLGRSVL